MGSPRSPTTVRATRASKPKVKTGCGNCKNRRVKCDETRPQCKKCVKSSRQCDGYPAHKRTSDVIVPIAPRPQPGSAAATSPSSQSSPASSASLSSSFPRANSIAIRSATRLPPRLRRPARSALVTQLAPQGILPSPTLLQPGGYAFDTREWQYFQVFRTRTASELSGFFDSGFWTRSVLQESHGEAPIRHAVIALGALYKSLEKTSESPPTSPQPNYSAETARDHWVYALSHCGKAYKRLHALIAKNGVLSQRTTLISIVLFACIDSFLGDHKKAICQIQHGLRVLEERRRDSIQDRGYNDGVDSELIQMFTRLAIQAKSYDMAFHFPAPYVIELTPKEGAAPSSSIQSEIPEYFTTSQEARSSFDTLCEQLMRNNEALSSLDAYPNNILPPSFKKHAARSRMQLQQWAEAFEPLLQSRRRPDITRTERAGINVIKSMHSMTTILFLMGFSTSEMDFDTFMPQFREIVELSNEVVIDEELALAQERCGDPYFCRHRTYSSGNHMQFPGFMAASHGGLAEMASISHSHIKASFALDLGIVPPLFVVATKCRDRTLRREAISLLMSSHRREGMWDSLLCGSASRWIMEVEEEDLTEFVPSEPLSASEVVEDSKRVMVKEILFDMYRREATIRCGTRGASDGEDDPRARETHIAW